jgi:Ubiquitin carboxyl-terminal hydrolase
MEKTPGRGARSLRSTRYDYPDAIAVQQQEQHQQQHQRHSRGLKGGHAIGRSRSALEASSGRSARSLLTCGGDSYDEPTACPKGLKNVGNTCYANATLQCLLNTALPHAIVDPKASAIFRRYSSNPNILAQGSGSVDSEEDCCTTTTDASSSLASHSSAARRKLMARERKRLEMEAMHANCEWLTMELRTLTQRYHAVPSASPRSWLYSYPESAVVDPGSITRSPNRLSSILTPYQQEDAHEFLRALLGTLVLHGQNKELSSLFDGLLESSVTCQTCYRPSLTRDRYMDLSLDIADRQIQSITDALREFTATETLEEDNAVFCRHCECKQTATKGLRLATAPSILVCHFKRFAYNEYGHMVRLKKHVKFDTRLEIGDYMSKVNQARPPPYDLVAVLVHQGTTCDHGHYLAYVKHGGSWYRCNDSEVERVNLDTVLNQQAYILMYEVAEMRENHGYHVPRRSGSDKAPPADDFFSLTSSMLLCGYDTTSVWSDICSTWGGNKRRRRRRRRHRSETSRDDLSTLGESTVESSDVRSRFRRSASSGNLRDNAHYGTRSVSVDRHRRQFSAQFSSEKAPWRPEPKVWTNPPTLRSRRELPPRPNSNRHRRVMSSEEGVVK